MFRLVLCLVFTVYLSFGYQGAPEWYERDDVNSATMEVFDHNTPDKDNYRVNDLDSVPNEHDKEFVDDFDYPMETAPHPLVALNNDPAFVARRRRQIPGTARRRTSVSETEETDSNGFIARRRRHIPGTARRRTESVPVETDTSRRRRRRRRRGK